MPPKSTAKPAAAAAKPAAKTAAPAAAPAKKVGAKPTAAGKKTAKAPAVADPKFPARPRSARIGGDIRPKGRDLSRFVRWPRYVRLQRQKKILLQRLKVPPAINQFNKTLDKNQASEVFKLLLKYQPETKAAKAARIEATAANTAAGKKDAASAPPATLKFGLKHVTTLIEQKKAKLVLIAHDVDPLELVVWLPALCRKMDVPYAIVKGKSRLGLLTHQKNTAVVALTKVNKEDESKLKTLSDNFHAQFNETVEKKWGGGHMGLKTQAKLDKRAKQIEAEKAKKLASQR
jgi:large subunit ribosomal protein L7Ae